MITRRHIVVQAAAQKGLTKPGYGSLYNWYAVDAAGSKGFLPGYVVPSTTEFQFGLFDPLGGNSVAGGAMRSTRTASQDAPPFWDDIPPFPSGTFVPGSDTAGFSAVPAGVRTETGVFQFQTHYSLFWSRTEQPSSTEARTRFVSYDSTAASSSNDIPKAWGCVVRMRRNATATEQTEPDGTVVELVQDFDGNWYEGVKIGDNVWTAQNLMTTHFLDGDPIPEGTTDWAASATPQRCWLFDDPNTPGTVYSDEFIEALL